MWIGIVSLFPEMIESIAATGVLGRAISAGGLQLEVFNPRDHAVDKHATVDDRPYGGGPGMVLMVEPLMAAIKAAQARAPQVPKVLYLSPQGPRLDQQGVVALAAEQSLVLLAGRYEGIDERVVELCVDAELSIGDYILTGGELAAMVVVDAVCRYLPGTLGNSESLTRESHLDGLLDYPHYTRPETAGGLDVPPVLLSGDHRAIEDWRKRAALQRTWERRPDLLADRCLSDAELALLEIDPTSPGPTDE
jgi:tRNA (guanine37-N1)-methyltransferase